MYGAAATCSSSGASRPTASAPALAASAARHHDSHVRSAAMLVRLSAPGSAMARSSHLRPVMMPRAMPSAVLLTGVGKRYDIVSCFARLTTVVAADPNPLAPAQYAATRRASVPLIADPGYIAALQRLCEEHDVGAIVPLT